MHDYVKENFWTLIHGAIVNLIGASEKYRERNQYRKPQILRFEPEITRIQSTSHGAISEMEYLDKLMSGE